jgi:hypothetical protein
VTGTEYLGAEIFREFCQAEPTPAVSKGGVSPTGYGNRVTGTEVGRSVRVTGDEPGTCKNVTGTEYLSPLQYDAYCATRPEPSPRRTGQARTSRGFTVSGNMVGRSAKVTGDEHGAAVRPTGTQYTAPSDIGNGFGEQRGRGASPGTAADPTTGPATGRIPPKVGTSVTLAGGTVTGTRVGRSERVTGDEPGSCRAVTGDEYVDLEQYQRFCETRPAPEPPKVGLSTSLKGHRISGTRTGRSARVTGDEPGTCKVVTGTPYAGLEQAADWCDPPQQQAIQARIRAQAATPGPVMTGQQPGIARRRQPRHAGDAADGEVRAHLTGADKGACEPLTGTPYVGVDQYAEACGDEGVGNGAQPGQADYPQLLDALAPVAPAAVAAAAPGPAAGGDKPMPWQHFSVQSPARAAFEARAARGPVTGTSYENGGQITGPFGMASGKVTGTEQARFDAKRPRPDLMTPEAPSADAAAGAGGAAPGGREVSRITGEGQTAGPKVTGDDWERGDRVTGTEGSSARRRNPTRPGPMGAMPPVDRKRNEEVPKPTSAVTGSIGSTDRGALITFSGGARG